VEHYYYRCCYYYYYFYYYYFFFLFFFYALVLSSQYYYMQACAVSRLLSGPNLALCPAMNDPLPFAKYHVHVAEMWNTAPKTVKIYNFGHNFAPQGRLFRTIFTKLSVLLRVYR